MIRLIIQKLLFVASAYFTGTLIASIPLLISQPANCAAIIVRALEAPFAMVLGAFNGDKVMVGYAVAFLMAALIQLYLACGIASKKRFVLSALVWVIFNPFTVLLIIGLLFFR